MSEKVEGKFKVKKITKFKDLVEGQVIELPESDLCFQNEESIVQMKYFRPEDDKKFEIKPGIYTLVETSAGLQTAKMELKNRVLLESVNNTSLIIKEAKTFFSKLDIYERLKRPKKRGVLVYSKPGMGKCLHGDTPVLMFDGTIKKARDIKKYDTLMGPDSTSRTVLSTVQGKETMYRVTPTKGDSYVVNESHILSLKKTDTNEIVNISVKEYLTKSNHWKSRHKGWRTGVRFQEKHLSISPYFLGLWLGDGNSECVEVATADKDIGHWLRSFYASNGLTTIMRQEDGCVAYRAVGSGIRGSNPLLNGLNALNVVKNKHVPLEYKTGSELQRIQLLGGLIDSDGHLTKDNVYDIGFTNKTLAEDTAYVARSLGLAAYINVEQKVCGNSKTKAVSTFYRVHISGQVDMLNSGIRLDRKRARARRQIEDVLKTGITVKRLKRGDYYGFEITGDRLFMLGDFTVTHNTSAIEKVCADLMAEDKGTVVVVWPTSDIEADSISRFLSTRSEYTKECTRLILIVEDIGGGERDGDGGRMAVDSGLLNLLDGVGVTFKLPTFIIATTNHPENLLQSLADRPGRFDLMLQLNPPSHAEKIELLTFISKRELNEEEKAAVGMKGTEEFSIAHLEEVAVRSLLHDKSYKTVIEELIAHSQRFKKNFEDKRGIGIVL